MKPLRIRFSSDILRRLGEELNPTSEQGIIELVKNAYDADALSCTVELDNKHENTSTIRVYDDGDGMDANDIRDGWLVLGKSRKSTSQVTALGRIPAGSKGLGRLAALRMGQSVLLRTTPRKNPTKSHSIRINWKAFEEKHLVDDVALAIDTKTDEAPRKHGTEITIEGVRARIGRTDVKRLARSLVLLADPFGDDPAGFHPILRADEFGDLEALVRNRYFSDADFHLAATLSNDGTAHARVVDWKGQTLFEAEHSDIVGRRKATKYEGPPSRFDLWIYILDEATFSTRNATISEVREWLHSFGGVHLYHNGLRVAPYGNPGNDWLDMNLRRAQSPEERPSTNTAIGRVTVYDKEGILTQKTDRSGFIEEQAFHSLQAFSRDSMEWLARRRLAQAQRRRTKTRTEAPRKSAQARRQLQRAIDHAAAPAKEVIHAALSEYDKTRDKEVRQLRKEVQLYRTLSTAGITAATFAHESTGNPIKIIATSIQTVERRAKQLVAAEVYRSKLEPAVEHIKRAMNALSVLGVATLKLLDFGKRRPSRVDLHETFDKTIETFRPFLDDRDVEVVRQYAPGTPFLRASEAAIESILTNFLNNSLAAFDRVSSRSRKIVLRTEVAGDFLEIHVMDSGPGIDGIAVNDVWLPGQTTKPNGTGLGLAIVHDTIADLGGSCIAIDHGKFGGAEFVVALPILGV